MKYYLVENLLTERPDDFSARVQTAGTADKDAIVKEMASRGVSMSEAEIRAVLDTFEEACADLTRRGFSLNTPLFATSFSIGGVFEGADDAFDASRHKFCVNLLKGRLLKATQSDVALEKTAERGPSAAILEVRDASSGTSNLQITRGGVVEVAGAGIKIAGDDTSCGLWFVCGGQEVKAQVIVQNKPSCIVAVVPTLPEGVAECEVKVATQFSGGGKPVKTPKTCAFGRPLAIK